MVAVFHIINSVVEQVSSEIEFAGFKSALSVRSAIAKALKDEDFKYWNDYDVNGAMAIEGYYETEIAQMLMLVVKTKGQQYRFQITVLGGSNPLTEIARLCKANSWTAYDLDGIYYLNLDNPHMLTVTDKDRERYFNYQSQLLDAAYQEIQTTRGFSQQQPILKADLRKWWQFWKS